MKVNQLIKSRIKIGLNTFRPFKLFTERVSAESKCDLLKSNVLHGNPFSLQREINLNEQLNLTLNKLNESQSGLNKIIDEYLKSFPQVDSKMNINLNEKLNSISHIFKLDNPDQNDNLDIIKAKALIETINKNLLGLSENFDHNIKALHENINSYLDLFSEGESLKEHQKVQNLLKCLSDTYTYDNNALLNLIQGVINRKLKILKSIEDISIINDEYISFIEIIDFYMGKRDKLGHLLNFENFEENLRTTIETFAVKSAKFSENSIHLANIYSVLSFFNLKKGNFETSEDFVAKALETLKSSETKSREMPYLIPYYVLAEICIEYHQDLKEAYKLVNECFQIIKTNSSSNTYLNLIQIKVFNKLVSLIQTTDNGQPNKIIFDVLEHFNHLGLNILSTTTDSLNLLITAGEIYKELGYYRQSYNFYKSAFKICNVDETKREEILESLVGLLRNSDDYNSHSKLLLQNNSEHQMEYLKELSEFFLALANYSVGRHYNTSKWLLDVLEKSKLPKSEQFSIGLHSASAKFMLLNGEKDNAITQLSNSLALIYNSQNLNKKIKLKKLIQFHFNIAINETNSEKTIENLEKCAAIVLDFISPKEHLANYLVDLLRLTYLSLARYYTEVGEHSKASLQLTKVNEFVQKLSPSDSRVKALPEQIKKILII